MTFPSKHWYALFILLCINCKAPIPMGTTTNWHGQVANLYSGQRKPIPIGRIDEKGHIFLNLNDDTVEKLLADRNEEKTRIEESSSDNFTLGGNTLAEIFPHCMDSIHGKNTNAHLFTAMIHSGFVIMASKSEKPTGILRYTSSEVFANAYFDWDQTTLTPGHFIELYYVDRDAELIGQCYSIRYVTKEDTTEISTLSYNLRLVKGWNYIKTEIHEVLTDTYGNMWPLSMSFSTIDKTPKTDVRIMPPN